MKFEGPEKKLEIILKKSRPDLRGNQNGVWDKVVASARTHIISHTANKWCDAYLLAESSLFVYNDRVIIITCGKSQLYNTVPELARIFEPLDVKYLFYERKNFLYPEAQLSNFDEETKPIQDVFSGQKFLFGPEDGEHIRVYFYPLSRQPYKAAKQTKATDVTLEILMHGIDQQVAKYFYFPDNHDCDVRAKVGINKLFDMKNIIYDEYFFHPCGYSLNALMDKNYFTIHVTPEAECSYVSFESNVVLSDYDHLVHRVLDCFKPHRFTLVITYKGTWPQLPVYLQNGFIESYRMEREIGRGYHVVVINFEESQACVTPA